MHQRCNTKIHDPDGVPLPRTLAWPPPKLVAASGRTSKNSSQIIISERSDSSKSCLTFVGCELHSLLQSPRCRTTEGRGSFNGRRYLFRCNRGGPSRIRARSMGGGASSAATVAGHRGPGLVQWEEVPPPLQRGLDHRGSGLVQWVGCSLSGSSKISKIP